MRGRTARRALAIGILWATAAQAQIPPPTIIRDDAQLFHPATDPSRFIQVYDTRILEPGRFTLGIYGNYAENPIQLRLEGIDEEAGDVVRRVWGANLIGAIGLTEWFQLGIDIPYVHTKAEPVFSDGFVLDDDGATLGDIAVEGKLTLLERPVGSGFGLSLIPRFIAPTGDLDKWAHTGELGGGGLLVADARFAKINYGLNVGYLVRDGFGSADDDDKLDDQLVWGAGITVPTTKWLDIINEFNGRTAFSNERTNPVEWTLGFRFHFGDIGITIGGGLGLNHSRGAPDYRVLAGITPYIPEKEPPPPMADLVTNSAKTWKLVEDKNKDGRANPGEMLEYEITLVNTGTATAEDVIFVDPIPENTGYVPGSMTLRGAPVTDDVDADGADYNATNANAVTAKIGTIGLDPNANSATLAFRVMISPEIVDLTVIRNEATVYHLGQPAVEGTDPETGPRAGEKLHAAETTVFPSIRERDTVVVTPDRLELTKNIHFEFNKAIIRTESHAILNDVAAVMGENPGLNISIEGHTDSVGGVEYNRKLSDKRAAAVKTYLVSKGVSASRLETVGRGELAPIATNDTAVGRAINRRVEFLIINPDVLRGKRIEKQPYVEDISPESEPEGVDPSPAAGAARPPIDTEPSDAPASASAPPSPGGDRVVLDTQRTLARLGYYRGPATGILDPRTVDSIKKFQSENGLPTTGVPDATTRKALDEALQLHSER